MSNKQDPNEFYQTWRNRLALDTKAETFGIQPSGLDNMQETKPVVVSKDLTIYPVEHFAHQFNTRGFDDHNFGHVVQPLRLKRPENLTELIQIVNEANYHGLKVKAVGSGHSYSDMTTTPDYLLKTEGLCRILKDPRDKTKIQHHKYLKEEFQKGMPDTDEYKDVHDKEVLSFYEFEAGIKIKNLNASLHKDGFGLINMGTYQGQAFVGAVSTSTHGSGIDLPPLPDMICSIVLVGSDGCVYRIEPSNGITNPATYKGKCEISWEGNMPATMETCNLIQDDDRFYSTLVNMGCFGIIYSLIIKVRPRLYLVEEIEWTRWDILKPQLDNAAISKNSWDYVNLFHATNRKLLTDKSSTADDTTNQQELIFDEFDDFERKAQEQADAQRKQQAEAQKNANNPSDENNTTQPKIDPKRRVSDPHKIKAYQKIRNTMIYVNPYPMKNGEYHKDGYNYCKIIRYYLADKTEIDFLNKCKRKIKRNRVPGGVILPLAQLFSNGRFEHKIESWDALKSKINNTIKFINRILIFKNGSDKALKAAWYSTVGGAYRKRMRAVDEQNYLVDDKLYGNIHYQIYLQGGDQIGGYAAEMGVPFAKGCTTAIKKSIEIAKTSYEVGWHVESAIISVRFVAASKAYMSPQYGAPTMMLEYLNVNDAHGGKELMYRYQTAILAIGGRPHWGLEFNVLNGCNNFLYKLYPKLDKWMESYQFFNEYRTFENRFTHRLGFSKF